MVVMSCACLNSSCGNILALTKLSTPFIHADDCNQVKSDTRMCSEEGQVCIVQTQTIVQSNAGLVLICRGGLWGTVATEVLTVPWSNKNAQVACRQAGFSGALNSMYPLT